MKLQALATAIAVFVCSTSVIAVEPVVDVGYAQYKGRIVGDGTTQWLGLRYAAPPLGKLRFRAPQKPLETEGVQDASKFGSICLPQQSTDWTMKPSTRFTVSEDCLFINVFAPSNATKASKLPVHFFIQGGGFTSNSNANYNGSDLSRVGNMVVVSINYRVGPYGFLMSKEIEKEGGLNAGIRDQILALEWVRDNIAQFGGNPSHVVIDGDSAGAASVSILLTSPVTRKANLFVGAITQSNYQNQYRTLEQGEGQYNCLLKETGCDKSNSTSLACLRSLNATSLQQPNCWFNPNFDSEIIPQAPFAAYQKGEYMKIPTIHGSCNEEGTKNTPQTIDTVADAHAAMIAKTPSLTNSSFKVLDEMYFLNTSYPVFPNAGRLWRNVAALYADTVSTCVDKIYQDIQARDDVPTWNYRYGVIDPEQEAKGFGAYHVVNIFAVWGAYNTDGNPPKSYNSTNAAIIPVVQGYWTSFVRHLDPNKGRKPGTPIWERRGIGKRGALTKEGGEERQRLHFITNGTAMEKMGQWKVGVCKILDPLVRVLEYEPAKGEKTELKME